MYYFNLHLNNKENKKSVPDSRVQTTIYFCSAPGSQIGADPALIGAKTWIQWKQILEEGDKHFQFLAIPENAIDIVWENKKPPKYRPLTVHEVKYSGNPISRANHGL